MRTLPSETTETTTMLFPIGLFGLYCANLSSRYYVTDDFGNLVRTRIPFDFWVARGME